MAEAAINNLEFGQFFTDIPATAAVPLSFKLKTLKGGATSDFVRIAEKATFEERLEDCDRPTGYEVTTELVRVKLTNTGTLPCVACVWLSQTGFFSLSKLGQGIFVGFAPQTKKVGKMEITSYKEPDRDALLRTGFDLFSSWQGGIAFTKTSYDYPFNTIDLEDGDDESHTLTALGATAKFVYRLTKKPNY